MKANVIIKSILLIAALVAPCASLNARGKGHKKHHRHERVYRPHSSVVVVSPSCYSKASEKRLKKALKFLKKNKYMSVARYARLMNMSHRQARAELRSFTRGPQAPMVMIFTQGAWVFAIR